MKEVTDFGFDLKKGEIDGYVECDCGKEIHFVIKKDKLQEIIQAYKNSKTD